MIGNISKNKLITELEKTGNVYIACLKMGISRAAFYRWKYEDKKFKKRAERAIKQGRENGCDIAEQSLMLKIKEKSMDAIKYYLGHNSPRYGRPRTTNVIIDHRSNRLKPMFDQDELDEEAEIIRKALMIDDDGEKSKDK